MPIEPHRHKGLDAPKINFKDLEDVFDETVPVVEGTAATGTALTAARRDHVHPSSGKFGGTGANGALSISSGTTNIDLGSAAVVVRNYSSVNISGTGTLGFTNPASGGTTIVIKCSGNFTINENAGSTIAIDLRSIGGAGGSAGSPAGGATRGKGGGGGASASAAGAGAGGLTGAVGNANGGDGSAFGNWIGVITGGGKGNKDVTALAAGGASPNYSSSAALYYKALLVPGSGGGGGASGADGTGGVGGRGASALYIEVGGAFNGAVGTINASGAAGGNGSASPNTAANGGGGGGGGAGVIIILYTTLTTDALIYTVTGGAAGTGDVNGNSDGGAGANGFTLRALNTEFV